jgi:hypothetical protein
MYLKLLFISIVFVALALMAFAVKMLFKPGSEFPGQSCALDDGSLDEEGACSRCQIKDLANCPENKKDKSRH